MIAHILQPMCYNSTLRYHFHDKPIKDTLERISIGSLMMSVPKLEVSDIQATVLRPRPSPFKGEYIILRIDDAAQGRI